MALLRTHVDYILLKRLGPLLTEASLDGDSIGSNADLHDPVGWAVRQLGLSVANVMVPGDSDLAAVPETSYDKLFDLAEYRALQNISGAVKAVDIQVGPRRESLSQLALGLEKRIERKRQQLQDDYGLSFKQASFKVH